MSKQCVVCGTEATKYDNLHPNDVQALSLKANRTYPVCDKHDFDHPGQLSLHD